MVIETYEPPEVRNRFYGYGSHPFNHDLVDQLQLPLSGSRVRTLVEMEYSQLPDNGWPTFVVSPEPPLLFVSWPEPALLFVWCPGPALLFVWCPGPALLFALSLIHISEPTRPP